MPVLAAWFHVVAAVVWFGGMLFMAAVMVPAARSVLDPPSRGRFMADIGRRFRPITWACVVVIVLTGVLNIHFRIAAGVPDLRFFMRTLTAKFLLLIVILALTAFHDVVHAPKAAGAPAGPPQDVAAMRRRMIRLSWIPRITVLLGLVVILLGLVLSHR